MHNSKSLFNMDISGGMPAVIIKMLVASAPGKIQLLPALPKAWPSGTIEGVLCRGQIEIQRLHWKGDRIQVTLVSKKDQEIELETPGEISEITTITDNAAIEEVGHGNTRKVALPGGEPVTIDMTLEAKRP